jgi:hypothetical protein
MPAPLPALVALGATEPASTSSPQAPPGIGVLADQLISWLTWGALAAGVVGLLVCAGMVVVGRRHRGGLAQDGLVGSLWVVTGLTLASLAAVLVGAFAGVGTP